MKKEHHDSSVRPRHEHLFIARDPTHSDASHFLASQTSTNAPQDRSFKCKAVCLSIARSRRGNSSTSSSRCVPLGKTCPSSSRPSRGMPTSTSPPSRPFPTPPTGTHIHIHTCGPSGSFSSFLVFFLLPLVLILPHFLPLFF
jgi:hypothetical protein